MGGDASGCSAAESASLAPSRERWRCGEKIERRPGISALDIYGLCRK